MIRDIVIEDEPSFKKLGLLVNKNFNNVYYLKNELKRKVSSIRVFEKNNKVIAFLQTEILGEETNVINIVVDMDYRRQHIADELLANMINTTKSKKILLEVRIDNKPAISLYKKHGFKKSGIRKGYYNGVDAITMVKEI